MKIKKILSKRVYDGFPYFGFGIIGGVQVVVGMLLILLGITDVLLYYQNESTDTYHSKEWDMHRILTAIDIPTWFGVWFLVSGSIAGCISRGKRIITALKFTKTVFLIMCLISAFLFAPATAASSAYIVKLRLDMNRDKVDLLIPVSTTFLAVVQMIFACLSAAICCCCSDTEKSKTETLVKEEVIETVPDQLGKAGELKIEEEPVVKDAVRPTNLSDSHVVQSHHTHEAAHRNQTPVAPICQNCDWKAIQNPQHHRQFPMPMDQKYAQHGHGPFGMPNSMPQSFPGYPYSPPQTVFLPYPVSYPPNQNVTPNGTTQIFITKSEDQDTKISDRDQPPKNVEIVKPLTQVRLTRKPEKVFEPLRKRYHEETPEPNEDVYLQDEIIDNGDVQVMATKPSSDVEFVSSKKIDVHNNGDQIEDTVTAKKVRTDWPDSVHDHTLENDRQRTKNTINATEPQKPKLTKPRGNPTASDVNHPIDRTVPRNSQKPNDDGLKSQLSEFSNNSYSTLKRLALPN